MALPANLSDFQALYVEHDLEGLKDLCASFISWADQELARKRQEEARIDTEVQRRLAELLAAKKAAEQPAAPAPKKLDVLLAAKRAKKAAEAAAQAEAAPAPPPPALKMSAKDRLEALRAKLRAKKEAAAAAAVPSCSACAEGIPNQEAHYGGCLPDPVSFEEVLAYAVPESAPAPAAAGGGGGAPAQKLIKRDFQRLHEILPYGTKVFVETYGERWEAVLTPSGNKNFLKKGEFNFSSPTALCKAHSSRKTDKHPEPTNPGNGWDHIYLVETPYMTIGEVYDRNIQ